ncbi:MAG: DUF512 domain-containing protein [Clostridia bacterium]|nr:DUF512 domain-containing protein [Clostridia bacterium]
MSVKIKDVEKGSICYKKISAGDTLVAVNSHEINDVLDYRFYTSACKLKLEIENSKGKRHTVKVKKGEYDDLGLCFETYLMDKHHSCKNKCIFCFIDQMPKGMRESLYFKDDDSRLSFLFGNYVTLTNLTDKDIDRIIEMHISPVNVSVHTMNPQLRVEMMKNPNSGTSLKYLNTLANAGIKLNTQLVLCPGINDGKELEFSLSELGKLYPAVQSIACVPVGLTKHRENLPKLEHFNKQTATAVIDTVDDFNAHFKYFNGEAIAYAADEFYICAKREIPDEEYYGDYPQLENGVGMWRLLETEFNSALENEDFTLEKVRSITAVTGTAAYPLIKKLAEKAEKKYNKLKINVEEIKNTFFGESVTVSGLLTGQDIAAQLAEKSLGDAVLVPDNALRDGEEVFLDDITLSGLSEKLGVPVIAVQADGYELLEKFLGINEKESE